MQASARASGTKVVMGIVIAAALLICLIAFWPWPKAAQGPAPSPATGDSLPQVTLTVDGMTCPT